jgi:hypothetical protein
LGKENKKLLLSNVIISHLSDESRNNLNNLVFLESSYQKPLFDYISFCKHFDTSGLKTQYVFIKLKQIKLKEIKLKEIKLKEIKLKEIKLKEIKLKQMKLKQMKLKQIKLKI